MHMVLVRQNKHTTVPLHRSQRKNLWVQQYDKFTGPEPTLYPFIYSQSSVEVAGRVLLL